MEQRKDFSGKRAEFEERPKFNWMILVFVLLVVLGAVMFAPISNKRSYTDTTQVRLMDAVLVEFEWTAEYSLPITTKPQERARYERHVRQIMNQGINEAVRGCFNSADLYAANTDTIYNSLYTVADFEPLVPKLDTLYITNMQFEAQFMEMIRSLYEAKTRKVQDSLAFEAHQIRAQQKLEAMEFDRQADSLSMAQREVRLEHEKRIAEARKEVEKINAEVKK